MRIGSITDLGLRRLRMEPAILSLRPRDPHSCPLLFAPFAGLSFVKLDNLVPSLRAITLDYFCLQSCAPPYTYSLEMIGVELEKENNARERVREGGNKKRKEERSQRDRTIERPFPLDCWDVCRESQRVISCACSRKFKLGN